MDLQIADLLRPVFYLLFAAACAVQLFRLIREKTNRKQKRDVDEGGSSHEGDLPAATPRGDHEHDHDQDFHDIGNDH